jgi:LPPG:FO 2-phospho-L-lactate transferase
VLTELSNLGSPSWFHIGDMDLATHLERTRLLKQEEKLSTVTRMLCEKWGVKHRVFPMTDETVATKVITASGSELDFQEYFVRDQCNPTVRGFRFAGIESASPAAGVLAVLEEADLVVICPSNPWVSIGPIIGIQSIREVLNRKPVIAVSPIIGGKTIKGPAAKMYQELGFEPSSAAVARHYGNLLQGFVIDSQDGALSSQISQWGIICWVTDTIMIRQDDRIRLARDIIHFGSKMIGREQK